MAIAQEPSKWTMPLGVNADANTIPDTAPEYTGNASMNSVFPSITQLPLEAGGIAPTRADFNGLFKLIGASIYYLQRGGIFSYADDADYPIGAVVKFENGIYIAIQENGPTGTVADPSVPDYWRHLTTTVNGQYADSNGNVSITSVANATNATILRTDKGNVGADTNGLYMYDSAYQKFVIGTDTDGNYLFRGLADSATNATNAVSADNGVDSQGGNYIRFKNGVQICWGSSSVSGFAFPKPFTVAPALSLVHQTFSARKILINVGATDGSNCFYNAYDVESQSYIEASVLFTAFGYWK